MIDISTAHEGHIDEIAQLDAQAARSWSEDAWRGHVGAKGTLTLVARDEPEGDIGGFATFSVAGDVADLLRVAVAPEHRRKRIGWELIDAGIDWAVAMEAERMMLEVDPDNEAAISLYRSLGFTDVTVRRDYYGSGVDALVMELGLATLEEWELTGTNK